MIAMPETEKIKEEIGWFKLLLGLLVVVNVPLVAWIVENFATASFSLRLVAIILALLFTCAMIAINFYAYRTIKKLGEL